MRTCPAIDIDGAIDPELALAAIDDFGPTAVEQRPGATRIFFATEDARRAALRALEAARYAASAVDVDDEDWARRSQEGLAPVSVGRLTIVPMPAANNLPPGDISIVIRPSMGFGTGHHASTRLCLAALQGVDLAGRTVLDVGTGSGILAIAAERLGARRALGIDNDPDAVDAARENLAMNPDVAGVEFRVADLASDHLPDADVVVANLTAALLVRIPARLVNALGPGGVLIVSGLLAEEREDVRRAFSDVQIVREDREDEWAALVLQR